MLRVTGTWRQIWEALPAAGEAEWPGGGRPAVAQGGKTVLIGDEFAMARLQAHRHPALLVIRASCGHHGCGGMRMHCEAPPPGPLWLHPGCGSLISKRL